MLVEHLVEVAALRRLHARRAAVAAAAVDDDARGARDQLGEAVVAALRDADAAGVAVVDEDRRAQRLRVDVRREAADVPAVAHREQRQHGDQRVLDRMQRAQQVAADLLHQLVGRHEPERPRRELARREVERDRVEPPPLGQAPALVGDDLVTHLDDAVGELDAAAQLGRDQRLHDARLGLAPRLRVPRPVEAARRARRGRPDRACRHGRSRRGGGRPRPRAPSRTRAPARACRAARRSAARRPRSRPASPSAARPCRPASPAPRQARPAGVRTSSPASTSGSAAASAPSPRTSSSPAHERQLAGRRAQVADADLGVRRDRGWRPRWARPSRASGWLMK